MPPEFHSRCFRNQFIGLAYLCPNVSSRSMLLRQGRFPVPSKPVNHKYQGPAFRKIRRLQSCGSKRTGSLSLRQDLSGPHVEDDKMSILWTSLTSDAKGLRKTPETCSHNVSDSAQHC